MKIVLCTLNAKYIHSSLALAYLESYCRSDEWQIETIEFTINDRTESVLSHLFSLKPDVLCFSCYIWNIENILLLIRDLKQILPNTIIVLGGPEVSYEASELIDENPGIDVIIRGEGEMALKELLTCMRHGWSLNDVRGIVYRQGGEIVSTPEQPLLKNLDHIPSPYDGDLSKYKNKIIYYESSRGCPFNCAYCLSAVQPGVRYFSLERVKKDLARIIKSGCREIKFVDRTFNCNEKRAQSIMKYILEQEPSCRIHLEICADLISSDFMAFLLQIPAGIFAFEIGVQSTKPETLEAVNRSCNWQRLYDNVHKLQENDNIHLHLDLIAGLPFETYHDFSRSFNNVFNLKADHIQLGLLKMLKGAPLREQAGNFDYVFQNHPPYQVLSSKYISYSEIVKLTQIEDIVERYYNSRDYHFSLNYIISAIYQKDAFRFFDEFASFWHGEGLFTRGHRKDAEYNFIIRFIEKYQKDHVTVVNEKLKYDYLLNYHLQVLPSALKSYNPPDIKMQFRDILRNRAFLQTHLGECEFEAYELKRKLRLEYFIIDPVSNQPFAEPAPFLFYYKNNKRYSSLSINLSKQMVN